MTNNQNKDYDHQNELRK